MTQADDAMASALRADTPSPRTAGSFPVKGKQLVRNAKTLRQRLTEEERWMWTELRALKPQGFRFRRQVPLGDYIVDFACFQSCVVIELDGNQHAQADNIIKDKLRDDWLRSQGFIVERFWNAQLYQNLDSVINSIIHAAQFLPLDGEGGRRAALDGRGDTKPMTANGGPSSSETRS